jgi:hypothetical protein
MQQKKTVQSPWPGRVTISISVSQSAKPVVSQSLVLVTGHFLLPLCKVEGTLNLWELAGGNGYETSKGRITLVWNIGRSFIAENCRISHWRQQWTNGLYNSWRRGLQLSKEVSDCPLGWVPAGETPPAALERFLLGLKPSRNRMALHFGGPLVAGNGDNEGSIWR